MCGRSCVGAREAFLTENNYKVFNIVF